jgi:hypothetical protein
MRLADLNLRHEERVRLDVTLQPGESIVWMGRPDPRIVFHHDDLYLFPFSLMWGGFTIFWERGVSQQNWSFGMLWGIPFVLIGQFMIWGRFLYARWKKKRILYIVTNKRVITTVDSATSPRVISYPISEVKEVTEELRRDDAGTITFGPLLSWWEHRNGNWSQLSPLHLDERIPVFVDIRNVREVAQLVTTLRNAETPPASTIQ